MEFILTVIAVLAVTIFLKTNKSIKAGADEAWNPAREVKPEDERPEGQLVPPDESKVEKPVQRQHRPKTETEPEQDTKPKYGTVPKPGVYALYGLIGKPLAHSTSMISFKKKFRAECISADYCNFELDSVDQITDLLAKYPEIRGLNVTIPYKTEIIPYLDSLDDTAREIGAVNVIKVRHNAGRTELTGYNTDCIGFEQSLRQVLQGRTVKALVLGTGGAAKAVCYALKRMGIEYGQVSRNSSFDMLGYYELSPSVMDEHQLIVNCTPVGMSPDTEQCPDIPYAYLSSDHILFDLIYNPETTRFMQKGIEHGATVCNGAEMLRIQAQEAWRIWNESSN